MKKNYSPKRPAAQQRPNHKATLGFAEWKNARTILAASDQVIVSRKDVAKILKLQSEEERLAAWNKLLEGR